MTDATMSVIAPATFDTRGSYPHARLLVMPPSLRRPAAHSSMRGVLRDLQHLSGLDLVGIAQHVAVRVENLHVVLRAAEVFLGDLAERVASLDGVGLLGVADAGCVRGHVGWLRRFDVG